MECLPNAKKHKLILKKSFFERDPGALDVTNKGVASDEI